MWFLSTPALLYPKGHVGYPPGALPAPYHSLTNFGPKGRSPWPWLCSTPQQVQNACPLPGPVSQNPHQLVALSTVPPGRSMEVTVPTTLNVLNGSDARLPCTFNSCYTVNHKQFSLNWTYQECSNCSEEMVSPGSGAG